MWKTRSFQTVSAATICLITLLVLLGGTPAADSANYTLTDPADFAPLLQLQTDARVIPDHYIVVLKENPQEGRMSTRAIEQLVDSVVTSHVTAEPRQRFSSALSGFAAELTAAELKSLQTDSRVAFIEPDQMMSISDDQSNPTWGLDRIDERDLPLDDNYHYDYDGSGVDVYVIDTGILPTHTDFGGRVVGGYNTTGGSTNDYVDCNGHGTHVAGTVGGNTWGVAKNVSLYAVRVLGCNGSGSNSGVIAGVDWVTDNANGPTVANMSLGGPASSATDTAVQNSIAAGITHVVASGNENVDACGSSPARVAAAITVNASNSNDSRASFSNFGSCTDIFAPGQNITSAWYTSNNATITISGTSMASPHVAGVAALYLSANGQTAPAQVKAALENLASPNKISNIGSGSPNLLLYSIVDGGDPLPTSTPTNTPTPLPTATPPAGNLIFFDDFETDQGWTSDPNDTDSATTGAWEIASPQETFIDVVLQLGTSFSGEQNLVTGALAGEGGGSFDVDDGVNTIESPSINLPATGDLTLFFTYYLAHLDNATTEDYFRIEIVGDETAKVFEELGGPDTDSGAWSSQSVDLNAFAGQTIKVLISASDFGEGSLIEAGVDDLFITQEGSGTPPTPVPTDVPTEIPTGVPTEEPTAMPTPEPPATPVPGDDIFFDDFESDLGWTVDPFEFDTASTGNWEIGSPEQTEDDGIKQVGESFSGTNSLVTGATAGEFPGSFDVDDGTTSVASPIIDLPETGDLTLSFYYYFAHSDNATADDFLQLDIFSIDFALTLSQSEEGSADNDTGAWELHTVDLSDFAGESIVIVFTAADEGTPSLIEAGIDDVRITNGDGVPPTPEPTVVPTQVPTEIPTGIPTEVPTEVPVETPAETPVVTPAPTVTATPTANPENQPPVVVNPGEQTVNTGEFALIPIEASDPENDTLSFSATGLSDEFFLVGTTGELFGLPFATGTYDITVTVTDAAQNATSVTFTLNVVTQLPGIGSSDVVYDDALSADWGTGVWGSGDIDTNNSTPVSAGSASIKLNLSSSVSSAFLELSDTVDLTRYDYLQFEMRGILPGQSVRVSVLDAAFQELDGFTVTASDSEWRTVTLALDNESFPAEAARYYVFKDTSLAGTIFLDNVVLLQIDPDAPAGGSGNTVYLPLISR